MNKYTHWAIARFDKHLDRVMWGIIGLYALIWFHPHPFPVEVYAVAIMVAIASVSFSIGVHITSLLIVKAEGKRSPKNVIGSVEL